MWIPDGPRHFAFHVNCRLCTLQQTYAGPLEEILQNQTQTHRQGDEKDKSNKEKDKEKEEDKEKDKELEKEKGNAETQR